uniref:Uncharacterized protein n=1 Tax=Ciona intestinalis TaxID=7719 RepID=H2XJX7_CIOIN
MLNEMAAILLQDFITHTLVSRHEMHITEH